MEADLEKMLEPANAFADKEVRRGFISKVYAILATSLIFTFSLVLLFRLHSGINQWCRQYPYVSLTLLLVSLVPLLILACCRGVARQAPLNYVILAIYVLLNGTSVAMCVSTFQIDILLMAIGITGLVVIALTVFAMQTKIDFTPYTGTALILMLVLLVIGIVAIFVRLTWLQLLYSSLGALLFSFYILLDTQLIVGGRSVQLSAEDYILAVVMLYMDIINLFLFILRLVAQSRGQS